MAPEAIERAETHGWPCAVGKCQARREFVESYDFLAGRRRVRLQHREVEVCTEHARQFADKHDITIAAQAAPATSRSQPTAIVR